jgi:hypothetical protein
MKSAAPQIVSGLRIADPQPTTTHGVFKENSI